MDLKKLGTQIQEITPNSGPSHNTIKLIDDLSGREIKNKNKAEMRIKKKIQILDY